MPVSSAEAEKLPYLVYKVLVWTRLVNHWVAQKSISEESQIPYIDERIADCSVHLAHWKNIATPADIAIAMSMATQSGQQINR